MNKLVGKLALVNDYKHRFHSQFHLAPSLKGTYPVHLNEEARLQFITQEDTSTYMFRNNFFDFKDENPRKRKRWSDISTGIALLRCVPGICAISKAKVDESHILPHTRSGIVERISYHEFLRRQTAEFMAKKNPKENTKRFTKLY